MLIPHNCLPVYITSMLIYPIWSLISVQRQTHAHSSCLRSNQRSFLQPVCWSTSNRRSFLQPVCWSTSNHCSFLPFEVKPTFIPPTCLLIYVKPMLTPPVWDQTNVHSSDLFADLRQTNVHSSDQTAKAWSVPNQCSFTQQADPLEKNGARCQSKAWLQNSNGPMTARDGLTGW